MDYIRKQLSDGISFSYIHTPKFKTDYIDIGFTVPLGADAPLYTLARCVLLRGCAPYPTKRELDRRLDYLYDTSLNTYVNKSGDFMTVGFELYSLKNRYTYGGEDVFSHALSVLDAVLLSPLTRGGAFLPEFVEGEKKMQCDAIRAEINNKGRYAVKKCTEYMCEGEPFAVSCLGTVDSVTAITPQALYDAYMSLLSRASVEILYIGTDEERALEYADSLADRLGGGGRVTVSAAPADKRVSAVRSFEERAPVSQSKLAMGFRTHTGITHEDYHAFLLFCELYASSPVSRLFMNVRERLSLCYYCSASVSPKNGLMVVSSGLEEKNIPRAREEISAQLVSLSRGEFTQSELDDCRAGLISSLRECEDSQSALSRRLSLTVGTDVVFDTEHAARQIRAVTPEQLARCAARTELDTVFCLRGSGGEED